MSTLLPVYTKPLPVKKDLLTDFFSRVAGKISVPDCGPRPTPKALRTIIRAMESELSVWQDTNLKRYPFENLTPDDITRMEYLNKTILHFEMALNGYDSLIDMSFLVEQRGNFPYFGITDIRNRGMEIYASKTGGMSEVQFLVRPDIPTDLKAHYEKTFLHLKSMHVYGKSGEIFISSYPSGKMNRELSERLDVSWRSGLFDGGIYVVFQADWKYGERVVVSKDPLIIGRKHTLSCGPMHYLIGMYDPTPMEEWVAEVNVKRPNI